MKKLLSIILALTLILPCISVLSLNASAKDNYDQYAELFEQREKYLTEDSDYKNGEYYFAYPYHRATHLTVLLYTEQAKGWTFERNEVNGEGLGNLFYGPYNAQEFNISCKEFDDVYNAYCKDINEIVRYGDPVPKLYVCIEAFGITKEEIIAANKKMQENPDSIRGLFPFLTDNEFYSSKHESGLYCPVPLEDYMIEALYIKDKFIAFNLLTDRHAVYVKEYNVAVSIEDEYMYSHPFWDNYASCDLTSKVYGDYFERCKNLEKEIPEIPDMIAEREKQLANPKTGENIIFLPVAAVALTLGVFAIFPRKKRRFE